MVKNQKSLIRFLYSLLLLFPLFLAAQEEIKVTSEISPYAIVGEPLKGTIIITHPSNENVDENSFRLNNQPLKVDYVKDVAFSPTSKTVLSIYSFTINSQGAGPQILPAVTVSVGGKQYSSIPSTYIVGTEAYPEPPSTPPSPAPSAPNAYPLSQESNRIPIILVLENIVEGSETLYPGQRATVGYRYKYNFNTNLSKEVLPLLQADGFQKIGAKDTKEYMEGSLNVLEIRQVIEAIKPGLYKFPSGVVEGRAYRYNMGKKELAPNISRSITAPVTLEVIPFPKKDKPASFNGAIGSDYKFSLTLLSSNTVSVGDKVELFIKIEGKGELETVQLPTICCQPGFSGFFAQSNFPPFVTLSENSKTFKVDLRPLSPSIKEIPPLEFTYFNPADNSYKTLKSTAIPLTVSPKKEEIPEAQKNLPSNEGLKAENEEKGPPKPQSIEIGSNRLLNDADLESLAFGAWNALLVVPLGLVLIFIQINMKNYILKQQKIIKPPTSEEFFDEAMQQEYGSSAFANLIQQAFLLKLVERGDIPSEKISPDYLPDTDAPGKVRALMREIEERRFGGSTASFDREFMKKIKRLFIELNLDKKP